MFGDVLDLKQHVDGQMVYKRGGLNPDLLLFNAFYDIELIRGGVVIARDRIKNGITNGGKDNLLNRWFNGTGTNSSSWWIGLIDNATFSSVSPADTIGVHSGWSEFTAYTRDSDGSALLRGGWTKGSASGQQITNSAAVAFTFTSNSNVYGMFLVSDGTKTGNSGLLWSTAGFNASLAVQIDDVLNVTYTLQL